MRRKERVLSNNKEKKKEKKREKKNREERNDIGSSRYALKCSLLSFLFAAVLFSIFGLIVLHLPPPTSFLSFIWAHTCVFPAPAPAVGGETSNLRDGRRRRRKRCGSLAAKAGTDPLFKSSSAFSTPILLSRRGSIAKKETNNNNNNNNNRKTTTDKQTKNEKKKRAHMSEMRDNCCTHIRDQRVSPVEGQQGDDSHKTETTTTK
eukprot:gene9562-6718_t